MIKKYIFKSEVNRVGGGFIPAEADRILNPIYTELVTIPFTHLLHSTGFYECCVPEKSLYKMEVLVKIKITQSSSRRPKLYWLKNLFRRKTNVI